MENTQKTWQKGPLGCIAFAGFMLAFLLVAGTFIVKLGGLSTTSTPSPTTTSTPIPLPTIQNATSTPTPTPKYFDVPSFWGKNIDQVKAILGTPKDKEPTQQQIEFGAKQWDLTFVKNGKELLVTYKTADKQIVDFFVSTDDPSGATKDKKHLLDLTFELTNVKENTPNLKIQLVPAFKDPNVFTGVKIIPN